MFGIYRDNGDYNSLEAVRRTEDGANKRLRELAEERARLFGGVAKENPSARQTEVTVNGMFDSAYFIGPILDHD